VTTTPTRRRPKRRSARKTIVVVVGLVVAFAVGIALGQALHDNPRPGGVQTTVRTLPPLTETGG
jgi:multisubunit Na+/H+ antiporter MnhB subunit